MAPTYLRPASGVNRNGFEGAEDQTAGVAGGPGDQEHVVRLPSLPAPVEGPRPPGWGGRDEQPPHTGQRRWSGGRGRVQCGVLLGAEGR